MLTPRSAASLGIGGLLAYIVAVLVSTIGGAYWAWEFTRYTLVPWMEIPHEWVKGASVLITFFVTWPIFTAVTLIILLVVMAIIVGGGALLLGRRR